VKTKRWHHCNVLDARQERRQLWQFGRDGSGAKLLSDRVVLSTDPLPERQVGRTLTDLWQPKLNVGWLPASQVFLRVIHLPPCDAKELPGMVELQIERLSPLPVAQIVWTFEGLSEPDAQTQTVVVIIAARSLVEEVLGQLESGGFQADRLELPQVQELLATPLSGDGVWLFPREEGNRAVCLIAWRFGGQWRSLNLLQLASDQNTGPQLVDLLKQMAWAGEMEGWLSANPSWHLRADSALAARLEPALRAAVGDALTVELPLALPRLASISAAAHRTANLVPSDFLTRYRQEFIDRLWMRALGGLGLAYLFGVLGFFAALQWMQYQKDGLDEQIMFSTSAYTNALQLRAKVQILQEQVNLKFAALDCWKAASEALPEGLTLTQLTFQRGKKLGLFGTVPADQQSKVTAYNEALAKATVNGQRLFSQVATRNIQGAAAGTAGRPMNWSIECEIRRNDL
jgi:hypothetical protein